MELLWVTRHGQTLHNVRHLVNGEMRRQVTLDDTGRSQAAQAGRVLADEPIDACFTSPFSRALDTAKIMLAGRSVPIHVRPGLAEVRCGDYFEGRNSDEYDAWIWKQGVFVSPPGQGGDSLAESLGRYHDELMSIADRPERVGLAVTHASPVGLARRVLGYVKGDQLLPLPAAMQALPYRIRVQELVEGLARAMSHMVEVAMSDELGRLWVNGRGLAG